MIIVGMMSALNWFEAYAKPSWVFDPLISQALAD